MKDDHVVLSERPENLQKAVEWGREQKQKILNDKGNRIADSLMEKMTPLILKNSTKNNMNKEMSHIRMIRMWLIFC